MIVVSRGIPLADNSSEVGVTQGHKFHEKEAAGEGAAHMSSTSPAENPSTGFLVRSAGGTKRGSIGHGQGAETVPKRRAGRSLASEARLREQKI
jgi:hypothetical protein